MTGYSFDSHGKKVDRRLAFAGQARAVAGSIALSLLLLSGCSLGGSAADGSGDSDLEIADPCDPSCCCKTKDNYYIRYSCSARAQCMADGGECATKNLARCRSEANPGS